MENVKIPPLRRRGRPARTSRKKIVQAARRIIESEGIDRLTMRRLADELQIAPMAIYRHVREKNEVLVLLLDDAYGELKPPRRGTSPRARLTALWKFLHAGLERYPWVVEAIVRSDLMAPSVLAQMEAILQSLIECGFNSAQAGDAYRVIWQFTVGELMLKSSAQRRLNSAKPSMVVQTLLNVDAAAMPTLAVVARYWFAPPKYLKYETGLTFVIDGLLAGAVSVGHQGPLNHRKKRRPDVGKGVS